jgi:hypothetical protein
MLSWWKKYENTLVGDIANIVVGFLIAVIVYNGLILLLGTQTPLVSVFSGSMEHDYFDTQTGYHTGPLFLGVSLDNYWVSYGKWYEENGIQKDDFNEWVATDGFKKGDMLLVVGAETLDIGDIIVFDSGRFNYPIIHRIVEVTDVGYKTKGDHNSQEDPWVIQKEKIYGKAAFVIPMAGWVKVIFSDIVGLV